MTAPIVQSRHPDLDALAARFAQQGEQVQSLTRQVTQHAEVLRAGGWEGRGKAAFLAEVDGEVTPALLRLSAALAQAGQVTAQIRLLILAAEEEAAAPFRGGDAPPGSAAGRGTDSAGNIASIDGNDPLNMSAAALAIGPALVKFLEFVSERSKDRTATLAAAREIGRFLNRLLGKTGNVGRMEELYRKLIVEGIPHRGSIAKMLASKGFVVFLAGADATFGAIEDWQKGAYNGDLAKIAGVNTLDGGIQLAIGLTPPGRIALIVNSLNQLIGYGEVNAMRFYADMAGANDAMRLKLQDDALSMEQAYARMDLTNVSKELGEAIWDGYGAVVQAHGNIAQAYLDGYESLQRDPSLGTMFDVAQNIGQVQRDNWVSALPLPVAWLGTKEGLSGVGDALKATGNVIDGFVDAQVIRVTAGLNRSANQLVSDVNHLPVSDAMKQQVSDAALDAVGRVQSARQWYTNLIEF
jgi:WXG100 family type VII secretion target